MPVLKPLSKELGEKLLKDIKSTELNEQLISECKDKLNKLIEERKKV